MFELPKIQHDAPDTRRMNSGKAPIQFAAYIENVKEVALFGTADLGFWREVLKGEQFYPFDDGGKAGILISAPNLVWKGVQFSEFSVSIAISQQEDGSTSDGFFLVHAFNSNRLLGFMERSFFRTPYYHAGVEVSERAPVSVRVRHGEEVVFEGKMNGERQPARSGLEEFEGAVYLPGGKHYFVARITGETDFYPYSKADSLRLKATQHEKVLHQLMSSKFIPVEWRIRKNATHGKSKTYPRSK